jgi:ABC-type amino acid transport substrate-binding protein
MKRFLMAVASRPRGPSRAGGQYRHAQEIKDTGTIVLGHRDSSPPFSFVGGDGKPAGYSVDLCTRVANSIQRQLGLPRLDIKWVRVAVDTRIPAVVNGTVDIECGSTTATLGRHEQVDFSFITFVDGGGLLATRTSGIRGVGDLGGKKVAVIPGTTTEKLATATRKTIIKPTVIPVKDRRGRRRRGGGRIPTSRTGCLVGLIVGSGVSTSWASLTICSAARALCLHAAAERRRLPALVNRALAASTSPANRAHL